MVKKSVTLFLLAFLLTPLQVWAVVFPAAPAGAGFNLIGFLNAVLNLIWPIFIGVAVIMFLIAGFMFLTARGDPAQVKLARDAVIYGVIGVVVGVLAFSIPMFIQFWFSFV